MKHDIFKNKKIFSALFLISNLLLIATINLFIIWQYSKKYYRGLEYQIIERNELIRSLYNNNMVLDYKELRLLDSLCLNDTIVSASILPKKISDSELRIIHNIMQNYIEIIENRDLQRYADLFASNISRFFLRESLSNQDVYYHMQWYWKTYSDTKTAPIIYNLNSMSIDKDSSSYIVFLPSKKGNAEIITELRLNRDFKIYYIRDYHAYIDKRKKK